MYAGEGVIGGKVCGSDGPWVNTADPADLLLLMEGSFGRLGFSFGADIALGVSACSWYLGDSSRLLELLDVVGKGLVLEAPGGIGLELSTLITGGLAAGTCCKSTFKPSSFMYRLPIFTSVEFPFLLSLLFKSKASSWFWHRPQCFLRREYRSRQQSPRSASFFKILWS